MKSSNSINKKVNTEDGKKYLNNSLTSSSDSVDVSCEISPKILPIVSEDRNVE